MALCSQIPISILMFCQIYESQELKLASSYHQYKHPDVRYYKQLFLYDIHTYKLMRHQHNIFMSMKWCSVNWVTVVTAVVDLVSVVLAGETGIN